MTIIERETIPTKIIVTERIAKRLIRSLPMVAFSERFPDNGETITRNVRCRIEEAYDQGYMAAYERFYDDPNVIDCHNVINKKRYNELIDSAPELSMIFFNTLPAIDLIDDEFEQIYSEWSLGVKT